MYEEFEPRAIVAKRGDAAQLEFLIRWPDGSEDTWEARATCHLSNVLTPSSQSAMWQTMSSLTLRLDWNMRQLGTCCNGDAEDFQPNTFWYGAMNRRHAG